MVERSIYIFSSGELKRKHNTIAFEASDRVKYVPVEAVREIFVFGEVDINKRFLEFLAQHEILLHYFSHHGYYMGTFYPREHYNSGYVIVKQVSVYLDPRARIDLARRFVIGSLGNMQQVLRYYAARGRQLSDALGAVESAIQEIGRVNSVAGLMGIEGSVRQEYYGAWDIILAKPEFRFQQRSRKPPANRLNAMISFLNSLLYTTVLSEIYKTHLDPRIGFLHESNFRRFSLNLDVAEVFKPILVDRIIFTLLAKNIVKSRDFAAEHGGMYLKKDALQRIVNVYEEKLRTSIMVRKLKRRVSYRRLIRLEIYKVQKHIMGDDSYDPYVSLW